MIDENIFGKIRGRFDEQAARRAVATLPDKWLATFMAMPPALRLEAVEKFNGFFQDCPPHHDRFQIRKI